MKKIGYTLVEALIALTIIGVLAGIMAPMVNKFKPDTNKIMFLKAYDSVVEATRSIASNRAYYPAINEDDNIDYTEHPLFNTSFVANVNGENFSGKEKYCVLLANALNGENIACTNLDQTEPKNDETPSFVTKNGMQFWVYTNRSESPSTGTYRSSITVDVNGSKGENCSDNCSKQDRFSLAVLADGSVHPIDSMTKFYIDTRQNYRVNKNKTLSSPNLPSTEFQIVRLPIPE